jgi:hypothetical protein
MKWAGYVGHALEGRKSAQGLGGEVRRKDTTLKTEA